MNERVRQLKLIRLSTSTAVAGFLLSLRLNSSTTLNVMNSSMNAQRGIEPQTYDSLEELQAEIVMLAKDLARLSLRMLQRRLYCGENSCVTH